MYVFFACEDLPRMLILSAEVEDKLSSKSLKRKRSDRDEETAADSNEDSTSDSEDEDEDEDDAGKFATEALDSEIFATLNAIKAKDPRVYDKKTTFYSQLDDDRHEPGDQTSTTKEKAMFLRDYHRENLLNGGKVDLENIAETPMTYNQEQEALKRSIVGEINAATAGNPASESSGDDMGNGGEDDSFLVAKPRKVRTAEQSPLDVENADKDPETFLSNFMAARAWVPSERAHFQPLLSDDDEEDRKAEAFEQAYNFRFEDPAKSNEKLVSHARDIAAKYSVRREENNARRKQRDADRERKEAAKRERAQEKAQLRKLKIEEAEEKLGKIKKAAGLKGSGGLSQEDWARFLDDDWNDARWEEEMQKRFGEAYYAEDDVSSDENGRTANKKSRKLKKPKWDNDVEINDLVPDFDEGEPTFELPDEALEEGVKRPKEVHGDQTSRKDYEKDREDKKKGARKERRMIEQLVDDQVELDTAIAGNQKDAAGFRYRETSPLSFGLSARDILMADDSQLNEYAGLKKLAAFRDPNKKKRDQKHLGKKARLRQWRRDTFGDEKGPMVSAEVGPEADGETTNRNEVNAVEGEADTGIETTKKKRRRSKKYKADQEVTT